MLRAKINRPHMLGRFILYKKKRLPLRTFEGVFIIKEIIKNYKTWIFLCQKFHVKMSKCNGKLADGEEQQLL
jgi:hypothetical protein